MSLQNEIGQIRQLQDGARDVGKKHDGLASDLVAIRAALANIERPAEVEPGDEAVQTDASAISCGTAAVMELGERSSGDAIAETRLSDILSVEDQAWVALRINDHVAEFNRRYALDAWDYAIAGSCGLFAAMLDILCVKAPERPSAPMDRKAEGIFNEAVQNTFNKILPPELSEALSKANPIGAPDSSVASDLINAPDKPLNPMNHRLRSLAHDPVLGLIIGVYDMINGTCTTVVNGQILSIPSKKGPTEGTIFELLGRMFGHLLSDINAPTANGNRGTGLPAPFMGLLRMLEGIPVGDSNFGKQIEWMYVNGYDCRQFAAASIPMLIMETLLRVFYVAKEMKLKGRQFGECMLETVPTKLHPRVRIMLAIAYGTSSAVNAGKIYVTQNLLDVNYASWMGLAWTGFHALKWALLEKHLAMWGELEDNEFKEIERIVLELDTLETRANQLPVSHNRT